MGLWFHLSYTMLIKGALVIYILAADTHHVFKINRFSVNPTVTISIGEHMLICMSVDITKKLSSETKSAIQKSQPWKVIPKATRTKTTRPHDTSYPSYQDKSYPLQLGRRTIRTQRQRAPKTMYNFGKPIRFLNPKIRTVRNTARRIWKSFIFIVLCHN